MPQYQDQDDLRETDGWIPLVLAAHGIILLVIVALVANFPAVSHWVASSAQAEFVNPDTTSNGPAKLAQPVDQMRIVRSN